MWLFCRIKATHIRYILIFSKSQIWLDSSHHNQRLIQLENMLVGLGSLDSVMINVLYTSKVWFYSTFIKHLVFLKTILLSLDSFSWNLVLEHILIFEQYFFSWFLASATMEVTISEPRWVQMWSFKRSLASRIPISNFKC